jgi:hypothetical protein
MDLQERSRMPCPRSCSGLAMTAQLSGMPTVQQVTSAAIEREYRTLESDLETLVAHGHCICFEIVGGVLRHSDWFVHPYCPQHGSRR